MCCVASSLCPTIGRVYTVVAPILLQLLPVVSGTGPLKPACNFYGGMAHVGSGSFATDLLSVRFARCPQYPESRHQVPEQRLSRWAKSNVSRPHQMFPYSMTSSEIASTLAGMSKPSPLAVLRLITSGYLIDCITGKSAGFTPLRIFAA
jgi:hypothetical protein